MQARLCGSGSTGRFLAESGTAVHHIDPDPRYANEHVQKRLA
jgi:hypothetical protein